MAVKKVVQEVSFPLHSRELPATQGMLHLVRSEVKADVRGLRSEMKSGFKQVDSRFEQMNARFAKIDARFSDIDARFAQIDARFLEMESRLESMTATLEKMASQMSRMELMIEEQNTRNQVVLEGLTGVYQRQFMSEERLKEVEAAVFSLAGRTRR